MLNELAMIMIAGTLAASCSKGHSPHKRHPIEVEENEDEGKNEDEDAGTALNEGQIASATPTPAPTETPEAEVSFRYNVPGGNNIAVGRLSMNGFSNTFPFPASLKRHLGDDLFSITGTWSFTVAKTGTLELNMQSLAGNCNVTAHDYLVLDSEDVPVAFLKSAVTSGTWHKAELVPAIDPGNYRLVNYIESSIACGLVHQFEAKLIE